MKLSFRTTAILLAIVFCHLVGSVEATIATDASGRARVKDVYTEIAAEIGVEILFDRNLRDGFVNLLDLPMEGPTAEEVLQAVAESLDHMVVEGPHGAYMIADDTPQKRREYEPLEIRLFALQHVQVKDADKHLRALIEMRRLATYEGLNTVFMRDTRAKLCVAERVIEIIDRPEPTVDLTVALVEVESDPKAAWDEVSPTLAVDETDRRMAAKETTVLWSGGMSLVGSRTSRLSSEVQDGRFSLEVRGVTHAGTGEVTLEAEIAATTRTVEERQAVDREGRTSSSARLAPGESIVFFLPDSGQGRQRQVLLRVTGLKPAAFLPEDLEPLAVGTENSIACGG